MATRDEAMRAIEEHEGELSGYPNVVGIGTTGEGDDTAIAVYVSERPADEADAVPRYVELADDGGTRRVQVTVQEIGQVDPEEEPSRDVSIALE